MRWLAVILGLALRSDDPKPAANDEPTSKPTEKTASPKASAVPFPQQVAKKNAWITVGSLAFQKHEVTRGEFALCSCIDQPFTRNGA